MRALMVSMVMVCMSLYAVAGCENSTLVVHAKSGASIKVYVDGSTGDNPATKGVTVNGVTPGEHLLKVVSVYTDIYGRSRRRSIYSGYINVRPSRYMDAWVEDNKGVAIHETKEPCDGINPDATGTASGGNAEKPYEEGSGQQYSGEQSPGNYQEPAGNTQANNAYQPDNNPGYQAPPASSSANMPTHISDDDFEQLKNSINSVKYETKKLDTLKILTGNTNFTTDQVGQLMGLFAFESNKLEVAKMLYMFTVDRKNYGRLASQFNFDARKEDFKKFMEGK